LVGVGVGLRDSRAGEAAATNDVVAEDEEAEEEVDVEGGGGTDVPALGERAILGGAVVDLGSPPERAGLSFR